MRIVTLLVSLVFPAMLIAAENTTQPDPDSDETLVPAEIETPADNTDTDIIIADIDEASDDDALGNGRFIPTEEISQDLGVSFPVDI